MSLSPRPLLLRYLLSLLGFSAHASNPQVPEALRGPSNILMNVLGHLRALRLYGIHLTAMTDDSLEREILDKVVAAYGSLKASYQAAGLAFRSVCENQDYETQYAIAIHERIMEETTSVRKFAAIQADLNAVRRPPSSPFPLSPNPRVGATDFVRTFAGPDRDRPPDDVARIPPSQVGRVAAPGPRVLRTRRAHRGAGHDDGGEHARRLDGAVAQGLLGGVHGPHRRHTHLEAAIRRPRRPRSRRSLVRRRLITQRLVSISAYPVAVALAHPSLQTTWEDSQAGQVSR